MLTGGNNIGRVGILQHVEKHPGSYDIVHIKDSRGKHFATRVSNVQVIGDGKKPAISLPKGEGIRLTLIEERNQKVNVEEDEEESAQDSD